MTFRPPRQSSTGTVTLTVELEDPGRDVWRWAVSSPSMLLHTGLARSEASAWRRAREAAKDAA